MLLELVTIRILNVLTPNISNLPETRNGIRLTKHLTNTVTIVK